MRKEYVIVYLPVAAIEYGVPVTTDKWISTGERFTSEEQARARKAVLQTADDSNIYSIHEIG